MRAFLTICLLANMAAAVLPPLDWRNYFAILMVALTAFYLGAENEERQSR